MSRENLHKLKEQWLQQKDIYNERVDDVFLRRSEVIQIGDGHTAQMALVTPTGFNNSQIEVSVGHNLKDAGFFSIRKLFQNFSMPKNTDLGLSINIENAPKTGKKISGDMPAVVVLHEQSKGVDRLVVLSILVDNLSTDSDERYGIDRVRSDSYSSICQRDSLMNGCKKFIDFAQYLKKNVNQIYTGRYGPLFNNGNIPDGSINFRNNILNLFSDQLPDSPNDSEKSKGIYCVSVCDMSFVPHLGFTGNSIILRSNADMVAVVGRKVILDYDDHMAAEAVARSLKHTSFERYSAKLKEGIYDVCGPNFKDHIGGFEISKHSIFEDGEGFYIGSDEKYGNVDHTILIQSDGYGKGSDLDDASKIQIGISGYYFE